MSWRWAWGSPASQPQYSHFAGNSIPTPNTLITLHEVPTLMLSTCQDAAGMALLSAGGVMGMRNVFREVGQPEIRVAGTSWGASASPGNRMFL